MNTPTSKQNKDANQKFFDLAADVYESVDGRRNQRTADFVEHNLVEILKTHDNGALLDVGCGSGFVLNVAQRHFKKVCGIDIAPRIVQIASSHGYCGVCGDISSMPFDAKTFSVASCFAVLHHCMDTAAIFKEIYRVLQPNGVFYSDHDIDIHFVQKFRYPLMLYRKLANPAARYQRANPRLTRELYNLSEVFEDGIDTLGLKKQLYGAGFRRVRIRSHWYGQGAIYDFFMRMIGNPETLPLGYAPSVSFLAVK